MQPRKRMRRHEVEGTARFLTFSCYRRLPLLRNPKIAKAFVSHLIETAANHRDVSMLAWVVMPEHVHLVLLPDNEATTSAFLMSLKRPFSRSVIERWRRLDAPILHAVTNAAGSPHFWQPGGGHDRNVVGRECVEKIRYCHTNPPTRELVERTIDYPFSSARAYEGLSYVGPPIAFDLVPPTDFPLT